MNLWIALGCLALGVLFIFLSAVHVQRRGFAGDQLNVLARAFLVCLRITIGWHFLVEGLDKLQAPNWSSEFYLRESVGPLAPTFRGIAGDALLERWTPTDKGISPVLEKEWQEYHDAYVQHYKLDDKQREQAKLRLEQLKADLYSWMKKEEKSVEIPSPYPPTVTRPLTLVQRLAELRELEGQLRAAESRLQNATEDQKAEYVTLKLGVTKFRAELKRDLDQQNAAFKSGLLSPPREEKKAEEKKPADTKAEEKKPAEAKKAVEPVTILTKEQKELGPVPGASRSVAQWSTLEWSNAVVKYGLIAVGGCLIIGLFSRLAAWFGALLLLSFFLAMPPLPWYPENPKAEGHYLFINKNIIEMFALLVLGTLPTGRWAGVDAFLSFVWNSLFPSATLKNPATGPTDAR